MYSIRPYQEEDYESILQIFDLNAPAFFSPKEKIDLANYLEHHLEDYFVVISNEKLVGAGGINYKVSKTIACISWDIIHPDFQGKGLGKKLLEHRINHIKDQNIRRVTVRTSQLVYEFYKKIRIQFN